MCCTDVPVHNSKNGYVLENNISLFLVMDRRLLSEASGDILLAKIPSPHKIVQLSFQPEMFSAIEEGSLLVADNIFLENLHSSHCDRIGQGLQRLPKLLKIQVRLLSMH